MGDLTETMRDLTKRTFRFSWSLSMFGVQQFLNAVTPRKAAEAFGSASKAMEDELEGIVERTFEVGDGLQAQFVDLAFGGGAGRAGAEAKPQAPAPGHRPPPQTHGAPVTAPRPTPASAPQAKGWGPMPFPVVPPASARPAKGAVQALPGIETDISPDYPFEPNYVEVLGSKMHYVDVGSGQPILILHGNPTWSYLWRNIIPHLQPLGRCIAPDLIGFGRSDKPDIEYHWSDHARYLEAFIEKMGLKNMILVLHDQGSGLGFNYAMRHEDNVKAIAFFEALIRPFPWDHFSTPEFRELFKAFRTGGVGGQGWQMIVDQNMFIEELLPEAAGRPLSETEMEYYREPFKDPKSRLPIWRFPRETAIGGEPKDVWDAVTSYSEKLQVSKLPKLLLYASPGALITDEHFEWAKNNIRNLKTVHLGPGAHFLQESSPRRIGTEIAQWIRGLPAAHR